MSDTSASTSPPPPTFADEAGEWRCPACDYDLRALQSERCPECGLKIDRSQFSISQIPWTHRQNMGRIRAWRRTVWLTLRRPRQIAADVARPVNFADARLFQSIIIWMNFLPLAGSFLWNYAYDVLPRIRSKPYVLPPFDQAAWLQSHHRPFSNVAGWVMESIGVLLVGLCIWLFLKAATGVSSYFFHPANLSTARQNRATAISYYACAPLALTPLTAALIALFYKSDDLGHHFDQYYVVPIIASLMMLCTAIQLTSWYRCSLVLLRHTTRCGPGRLLAMALVLPAAWLIIGAITLFLIPVIYTVLCIAPLTLL